MYRARSASIIGYAGTASRGARRGRPARFFRTVLAVRASSRPGCGWRSRRGSPTAASQWPTTGRPRSPGT